MLLYRPHFHGMFGTVRFRYPSLSLATGQVVGIVCGVHNRQRTHYKDTYLLDEFTGHVVIVCGIQTLQEHFTCYYSC